MRSASTSVRDTKIFKGMNMASMTLDNVIKTSHDEQTHTCNILQYDIGIWMHMRDCENWGTHQIIQNDAILAMKPAWAS